MCIYVYIILQREYNLFNLQRNVHKTRALHFELQISVLDTMASFWHMYGEKY